MCRVKGRRASGPTLAGLTGLRGYELGLLLCSLSGHVATELTAVELCPPPHHNPNYHKQQSKSPNNQGSESLRFVSCSWFYLIDHMSLFKRVQNIVSKILRTPSSICHLSKVVRYRWNKWINNFLLPPIYNFFFMKGEMCLRTSWETPEETDWNYT